MTPLQLCTKIKDYFLKKILTSPPITIKELRKHYLVNLFALNKPLNKFELVK